MEIHRKEQNLTPLLNQVRNDAIDDYEKFLPDYIEIAHIIAGTNKKQIGAYTEKDLDLGEKIAKRIGK